MRPLRAFVVCTAWLWVAGSALAQEVVLDKQVAAGGLTLLPSVNNPNDYYYVADRVALARTPTACRSSLSSST